MTLAGWFLQYFLIFVVLVLIAVAGFFIGKKLRANKDAKTASAEKIESKDE